MSRILRLAAAVLLTAAAPAAAQEAPRDTIVLRAGEAAPTDTLRLEPVRPARWSAPFAVESSGRAVAWRPTLVVARVHPDTTADADVDEAEEAAVAAGAEGGAPRDTPERASTGDDESAVPSGRPRAHRVAAGETLFGIARRYGVTTAQLRVLNPSVDAAALEVGTVLRLPATAHTPSADPRSTSEAGDAAARRTHTVEAGETLFGIARRYRVSVDAIMRANRMEQDQVRAGQTLVIP